MRNPFKRKPETRAISVPWAQPFNYGGTVSASVSQCDALSLAPVYSAVRIIAQDVSTLPLKAYRKVADERVPMPSLPALFDQLETSGRLIPWLFECVSSLALRGNAYGLITARDGFGFPTAITWLNPSEVTTDERYGRPAWFWRGREVPSEDIVHIRWFALPGDTLGLSPIASFARTIGVGLKAQGYASDWFDAGGFPPGTFQNTESEMVDQNVAEAAKARITNAIRSRQPLVYGKDWKYDPISIPPGEAQFIETMKLTANQIAPIYGVRPEKIGGDAGGSLTYATVEQNQLEYTTTTLRFWCELLEGAFFALLPERQYVKFNVDALVRADVLTRWRVHQIAVGLGARSLDEVRALEDQPALPNGQGKDFTPAALPPVADQPPAEVVPLKAVRSQEWTTPQ